MSTPKATWHVKSLLLTDATEAWVDAERVKNPNLTDKEILRNRLHEMALVEIRAATVLAGIAAQKRIRLDGDGS